jgi:hypothetical protein
MIKKSDAIHSLVPESTVSIDIDGNVTWICPEIAPVTDEQIIAEIVRLQAVETAKQEAEVAAKESAIAKLTAIGLTADEIAALGVK